MNPNVELQGSKDRLICMARLVDQAFDSSLKALFEADAALGYSVIEKDKAINAWEIEIDNATYSILTVAHLPPELLRVILAIQKINATLERIGDHAVNIAESAITLVDWAKRRDLLELPRMAEFTQNMFRDAVNGFDDMNWVASQGIFGRDEEIDNLNISITNTVKSKILCGDLGDMSLERGIEMIRICKNLERVADLSTNIAEETGFAAIGRVVKHHNG
jgi:phosphate transport system protein